MAQREEARWPVAVTPHPLKHRPGGKKQTNNKTKTHQGCSNKRVGIKKENETNKT